MTSRRQFLQANSIAMGAVAAAGSAAKAQQAGGPAPHSSTLPSRDYWNDVPNALTMKMNKARAKRKGELGALQSQGQAEQRLASVRENVWALIGGRPDQSPLNSVVTGVIERGSYRIEKLIFESQPKFFVTAHLYLPKASKGPFPGILAPVGHAPDGKTFSSYQTLFQNLARQGFAVLTWDPPGQGERLQYLDPKTNESLYGPTGEHDRFGWPALLTGSTTTQFEAWDGVRALDYLLSRPEIDAKRIGCCGHSGGGTQTMFLCAIEPRIQVAIVVEGHTENLAGADYQPPGAYADAEQNIIGGLKIPIDRGDLLAAFAPKPLLICYTPVDVGTTYSPHYQAGTEEIYGELQNLYKLYGAEAKVSLFHSTLPHDYDFFHRRSTYGWFNKWLLERSSSALEEVACEEAPAASLWCTSTGQVLTSLGGRAAYDVNFDRLKQEKSRSGYGQQDTGQIRKELRELLNLPGDTTAVRATSLSSNKLQNVLVEEFHYESEPGIRVPGWFLKPAGGAAAKLPVAVMIQDQGRDVLFDQWTLIENCIQAGIAVCSIDLRTCGVTRPRLPSDGPSFYGDAVELAYSLVNLSIGSPIIGQQVLDLLCCLDYLQGREDVDTKRIGVSGTGVTGLPCQAAAVLDERVSSLLLDRTLLDLESIVASRDYNLPLSAVAFGMLKRFDLPDLAQHLVPRAFWLVNPVGPQREDLALSSAQGKYAKAVHAYQASQKMVMKIEPGPASVLIFEWAQKTLA